MLLSERRKRYRSAGRGMCVGTPASVFDAMSARMAQSLGFEVGMLPAQSARAPSWRAGVWLSSTLTEFAEQIRRIGRAVICPSWWTLTRLRQRAERHAYGGRVGNPGCRRADH